MTIYLQSLTQNGHSSIKSGYQWLTGVTLYTWAAYVGYSRIEIDKHYFTDVAVGSVIGLLFEEIYYRFNQKYWNSHPSWRLTSHATPESFQFHFAKLF
ncbi:phosphatase PAP2 family protein [bacterium]|nr:phosphatase PAP2 family protein [bacterium]